MDTAAQLHPPADAGTINSMADDRLEGAEAIGRFIDPNLSLREVRRRLDTGRYPYWHEGRRIVASKSALLAHWRKRAATAGQPQQPESEPGRPRLKSNRRGYRPR